MRPSAEALPAEIETSTKEPAHAVYMRRWILSWARGVRGRLIADAETLASEATSTELRLTLQLEAALATASSSASLVTPSGLEAEEMLRTLAADLRAETRWRTSLAEERDSLKEELRQTRDDATARTAELEEMLADFERVQS